MKRFLSLSIMAFVFLIAPSTSKANGDAEWEELTEVYENFKTMYEKDTSEYSPQNLCVHWVNTAYVLSEFYRLRGDVTASLAKRKTDLIHINTRNKQAGRDGWVEFGEELLDDVEDLSLQLWHMTNHALTRRAEVSINIADFCLASH